MERFAARENTLRAYDALGRSARREISEELLRAFRDQLRFEEETGRGKEGGGCTKEGMVLLSCMRHHAHAGGVLMQGHAKYMKEVLVWLRRESGDESSSEVGSAGGEVWQPPTGEGGEEEGKWVRAGESTWSMSNPKSLASMCMLRSQTRRAIAKS